MIVIAREYVYKITLVGDYSTGKSSLLKRFINDHFEQTYRPTIGVDFNFKTLEIDQRLMKLQIWDTAGQQRFRNITKAYYKNSQGVIIVFDITNWKTFQSVQNYWLDQVKNYDQQRVQILLIGNKIDKARQDLIIESKIDKFKQKHNINVFLCSAKTGQNVKQAFQHLALLCFNSFGAIDKDSISSNRLDGESSAVRQLSETHIFRKASDSQRKRKQKGCC